MRFRGAPDPFRVSVYRNSTRLVPARNCLASLGVELSSGDLEHPGSMRFRSFHWLVFFLIFASVPALARAQGSIQIEQQVNALRRLFPEIGGGVRAVKSGPNGELLVLLPQKILLYDAKGAKIREMPAAPASRKTPPALMYGEAFDVDAAGKVYVADRGAGMLRIFSVTGDLESSVPVESPTGVVLLASGEVAVASVSPRACLPCSTCRARSSVNSAIRSTWPIRPRSISFSIAGAWPRTRREFFITHSPPRPSRRFANTIASAMRPTKIH